MKMDKVIKKLAKWMTKAADATTRKQALKAAKKYEKWNKKLIKYDSDS